MSVETNQAEAAFYQALKEYWLTENDKYAWAQGALHLCELALAISRAHARAQQAARTVYWKNMGTMWLRYGKALIDDIAEGDVEED